MIRILLISLSSLQQMDTFLAYCRLCVFFLSVLMDQAYFLTMINLRHKGYIFRTVDWLDMFFFFLVSKLPKHYFICELHVLWESILKNL